MTAVKLKELVPVELEREMQAQAIEAYPKECGGVIVSGEYIWMDNLSPEPEKTMTFDRDRMNQFILDGTLEAVFHSHPDGPHCPSYHDMCFQEQLAVPFLLASTNGEASTPVAGWGDQLEIPALERRFFHHGITDCYAAIRDWWRVNRGTLLPQFNRGWEWWLQNKNLYIEGFPKAGFRRMNEDEIADAKAGDVILFNVRSKVPNHGGVYLGNGLMYHHATQRQPYEPTKLATTEPVARWMNFQPIWLRRDEDDQSIRKAG